MRPFLKSANPSFTNACARQFGATPALLSKSFDEKLIRKKDVEVKLCSQALYQALQADKRDLSGYKIDTKNDLVGKYLKPKTGRMTRGH